MKLGFFSTLTIAPGWCTLVKPTQSTIQSVTTFLDKWFVKSGLRNLVRESKSGSRKVGDQKKCKSTDTGFDHCASSVGVSHVAISQILWLGYRHIMSYGQAHTNFRLPAAAGNIISP